MRSSSLMALLLACVAVTLVAGGSDHPTQVEGDDHANAIPEDQFDATVESAALDHPHSGCPPPQPTGYPPKPAGMTVLQFDHVKQAINAGRATQHKANKAMFPNCHDDAAHKGMHHLSGAGSSMPPMSLPGQGSAQGSGQGSGARAARRMARMIARRARRATHAAARAHRRAARAARRKIMAGARYKPTRKERDAARKFRRARREDRLARREDRHSFRAWGHKDRTERKKVARATKRLNRAAPGWQDVAKSIAKIGKDETIDNDAANR